MNANIRCGQFTPARSELGRFPERLATRTPSAGAMVDSNIDLQELNIGPTARFRGPARQSIE
jgi:hypothetical protein